jgi:hypothetical protein
MFFALAGQGTVLLASALMVWRLGALQFWPFLYGGGVAMANAGLLAWRWKQGLRKFHCDGQRHLKRFHRSLMERFFVVVLLLAAGFAYRLAEPSFQTLAMLSGFVVGQLAWVIAAAALKAK